MEWLGDLDWKEQGGKMAVVLDDVLGDGGLKGADTDIRHSVLWAATVICNNNIKESDTEF